MNNGKKTKKLKKELGLSGVYAIAAGTTLSAGFFLLPGLAANVAGPAIILAYLLAAIPLIPAMFSIIELATAMPRAGGVYYFLDRTLGPFVGTIGGLGTWLALVLKVSFALVGMGAYIRLFVPELPITPIAVALAIALGILNLFGAKKSGNLQIFLVIGLLAILALFITGGVPQIHYDHFTNFFDSGFDSILATTGLVYISYVGITKVASLSEEVKNPERNIPLGVILALATAIVIYGVGTTVMVGVVPMDVLKGNLTPVAEAGEILFGKIGEYLLSIAALLAFVSVANAGTLSASRYPLAMSRDHLLPKLFRKLDKSGTPVISIIVTVSIIVLILIFLDPMGIAKLASAFQLLMFALVCLGVIVMRESKIEAYDPGYKSPFYPYMQWIGILVPFYLIYMMGILPTLFSLGLVFVGSLWYIYYARDRVERNGAIYHIFERLGKQRYHGLDIELRGILKEKGLREEDPFDEIVARSFVIDLKEKAEFEDVLDDVSIWMAKRLTHSSAEIKKQFLEGTRMGATPVTHGMALPHLRIDGLLQPEMVLVRCLKGVHIKFNNPLTDREEDEETVTAIFFLISPEANPAQHLRILAQIAGRVDEDSFAEDWINASNEREIQEALLHDERWASLILRKSDSTKILTDKLIKEINIPENCLIALIRRDGKTIVPKGDTMLKEKDRLTIIGDPKGMKELNKIFSNLDKLKTVKK